MIIKGSAYSENGLRAEYEARFKAVKHLQKDVLIDWWTRDGSIDFKGTINSLEALDLSELDLALLITSGQLDFGGKLEKVGDTFTGVINL